MREETLAVVNLKKHFPINPTGWFRKQTQFIRAVDGVSFSMFEGECFGLVGESGSGKSVTAYTVMGVYTPSDGQVLFRGQDISMDVAKRPLSLKKEIQIVFQDPGSSLNPKRTVRQILEMPMRVHGLYKHRLEQRLKELLDMVELPASFLNKYPLTLGGGERQAVAIARAMATDPSLVILDEPTSALDVSVQAKIINDLMNLQQQYRLSYLFITHDLSLMRNVADRVAIIYLGKLCEIAQTQDFFNNPFHPYTQMLLSSVPVITEEEERLKPKRVLSVGEIPSPVNVPPGCSFHTRCHMAYDRCRQEDPIMREYKPGHWVRCHLYEEDSEPSTVNSNRRD